MGRNKKKSKPSADAGSDNEEQETPQQQSEQQQPSAPPPPAQQPVVVVEDEEEEEEEGKKKKAKHLPKKAQLKQQQQKQQTPTSAEAQAMDESSAPAAASKGPCAPVYCPMCTFPVDMCEYSGVYETKCKPYKIQHAAEAAEAAAIAETTEKGRKRKETQEQVALKGREKVIQLSNKTRARQKMVTLVAGMDMFGFKLPEVAAQWKKLFACACTVIENPGMADQLELQGELNKQVVTVLTGKPYNIPLDAIFIQEKGSKPPVNK